jgi:hypothetical protein
VSLAEVRWGYVTLYLWIAAGVRPAGPKRAIPVVPLAEIRRDHVTVSIYSQIAAGEAR